MADGTLRADSAPSKLDNETSQQQADRLLTAHRAETSEMAQINRQGLATFNEARSQFDFVRALTHAVMELVENIHGLAAHGGESASTNLASFSARAITLLRLQLERGDDAAEKFEAAAIAWRRASAQA